MASRNGRSTLLSNRGSIMWVPELAVEEVQSIKLDLGLGSKAEAFRKMAKYCQVGRETEKMRDNFLFLDRRRRKP